MAISSFQQASQLQTSPISDVIGKIKVSVEKCISQHRSLMSKPSYFRIVPLNVQMIFDEIVELTAPTLDFRIDEEITIKYLPHLASRSGVRFAESVLDSKTKKTTLEELLSWSDLYLLSVAGTSNLPSMSQRPTAQLPLIVKKGNEIYIYGRKINGSMEYTKLDESKFNALIFPPVASPEIKLNKNQLSQTVYDEIVLSGGHTSKGIAFEGWREKVYLFLRCCHLLKLIVEIEFTNKGFASLIPTDQMPSYTTIALPALYKELAITIETTKNCFELLRLKKGKQPFDNLVREISEKIGALDDGDEYVLVAGGTSSLPGEGAHAVYVAFQKIMGTPNGVAIRIDNRGFGINDTRLIHPMNGNHVSPKILATINNIYFQACDKSILQYLYGICNSFAVPQELPLVDILRNGAYNKAVLQPVADLKCEKHFISKLPAYERKQQKVGNCVVQSWEFGSLYRLKQIAKELYKMQKKRERYFAVDFDRYLKESRAYCKANPSSQSCPYFNFIGTEYEDTPISSKSATPRVHRESTTSKFNRFFQAKHFSKAEEELYKHIQDIEPTELTQIALNFYKYKQFYIAKNTCEYIMNTYSEKLALETFMLAARLIEKCDLKISAFQAQEFIVKSSYR